MIFFDCESAHELFYGELFPILLGTLLPIKSTIAFGGFSFYFFNCSFFSMFKNFFTVFTA